MVSGVQRRHLFWLQFVSAAFDRIQGTQDCIVLCLILCALLCAVQSLNHAAHPLATHFSAASACTQGNNFKKQQTQHTCYDNGSARQPVREHADVHKVGPSDMSGVRNLARPQDVHKCFICILFLQHMSLPHQTTRVISQKQACNITSHCTHNVYLVPLQRLTQQDCMHTKQCTHLCPAQT